MARRADALTVFDGLVRKVWVVGDIQNSATLLGLAVIAWITPARAWGRIAAAIAAVTMRLLRRPVVHVPEDLAAALGPEWGAERARAVRVESAAVYFEERLQVLASYRPGGWRPSIKLSGIRHLETALSSGNGAILWVSAFASSDLIAKMALSDAGHRVSHLSRPPHGFSESVFGIRFLNPIRTRIEDRYLAERVTLTDESAIGALRVLRRRLQGNQVVSITVGNEGEQTVAVPFLRGKISVATGPATLARAAGAPLLPVFTIRLGTGSYAVQIGEPIHVPESDDRAASAAAAVEELAMSLSEHVARHPALWNGWRLLESAPGVLARDPSPPSPGR